MPRKQRSMHRKEVQALRLFPLFTISAILQSQVKVEKAVLQNPSIQYLYTQTSNTNIQRTTAPSGKQTKRQLGRPPDRQNRDRQGDKQNRYRWVGRQIDRTEAGQHRERLTYMIQTEQR